MHSLNNQPTNCLTALVTHLYTSLSHLIYTYLFQDLGIGLQSKFELIKL